MPSEADHSNQPGREIVAKVAANISLAELYGETTRQFELSAPPLPADITEAVRRATDIGWSVHAGPASRTVTIIYAR